MDSDSQAALERLVRLGRWASLGTLHEGQPNVSLVLFAAAQPPVTFYIHISRLAHHTRDLLADQRAGWMIAEGEGEDLLNLPRVSILGEAEELPSGGEEFVTARKLYLARHPQAALNFQLTDFSLFALRVKRARFVAGFGKIFNLTGEHFRSIGS